MFPYQTCLVHSVKEFMDFTSKIIIERTNVCQRASVKEQGKAYCGVKEQGKAYCGATGTSLLAFLFNSIVE